LALLDRESPTYALDVVSVIESTLEDPRQLIAAQLKKARGEAVAAMKAEGIEYEERLELLDEVTHPQPLLELLETAYEMYQKGHPWIADHPLRPKSVVREMYEQAMTFGEYVASYGLARSEGSVLRYLTDTYRALRQTVPSAMRNDELEDLIEWLGELTRQVDSSLLNEWEKLAAGEDVAASSADLVRPPVDAEVRPVTGNARAFRVLVRNAMFRRVELAARRDWEALGELDADAGWSASDWADALAPYWEEHAELLADADARGPRLLMIDDTSEAGVWHVRQILHDPEGYHDWALLASVDLAASDEAGYAVVHLDDIVSG
jgi:hypothetical protein